MRPVVTPTEMAAIDAEAPEPVEELIERAGWATAKVAVEMLAGSTYGKRVAVLAGSGNNGADGRSAARYLERRGVRCTVVDVGRGAATDPIGGQGHRFDLVIDACVGTGLGRPFDATVLPIEVGDTPVLAVDIPSGVDGASGEVKGHPLCATRTVTFAAAKPGLLLPPGDGYAGRVTVADIGLDCSRATVHHLGPDDVAERWPRRPADGHKWRTAVRLIGGSPGLTGAVTLAATAAFRAGAGYVARTVPGEATVDLGAGGPVEAVAYPAPARWADAVTDGIERFAAAVVGPGLDPDQAEEVRRFLGASPIPVLVDAGGLVAFADGRIGDRGGPTIITPHDGEFARLTGERPGPDRIGSARSLAASLDVIVLLKGQTTVVAAPDGRALLSTAGDARLATAGTGDVLAGIIGAGLAGGLDPFLAAGLGAELHGLAAAASPRAGLVASDLPDAVATLLSGPADGGTETP